MRFGMEGNIERSLTSKYSSFHQPLLRARLCSNTSDSRKAAAMRFSRKAILSAFGVLPTDETFHLVRYKKQLT